MKIALSVVAVVAVIGFKVYYDVTQEKINQYAQNEMIFKQTITDQNETIADSLTRYENSLIAIKTLAMDLTDAQREMATVREKFAKHDLGVLSLAKPKLIENIINKGTAEVLDDLTTLTDSSS